jgi:hypothetical protein
MRNAKHNESISCSANQAKRGTCAAVKTNSVAWLVLAFFAILSMSGCTGVTGAPRTSSSQGSTTGAAGISVAPASIKFGSVSLGSTASQSMTISNDGTSTVTITSASATAAGVTVSGITLPAAIPPGKQSTFDVVFAPKTAGALSGQISVVSAASSTPFTVSLSGVGAAATALLTASTSGLNFGNIALGKSSNLSVTLTDAGNSNITVSKVTLAGAGYSTSGVSAGLILTPGQSATLDETFTPASAGSLPGSVTIVSNATNSPAIISLSGSGSQTASHSVTLTWAASTSSVVGYDVFRSQASGGPYTKLDSSTVAADSYTDASVQAGQTYYYVVTSVNASGVESADSTQTAATIPTP